jgi:hypothetical protein
MEVRKRSGRHGCGDARAICDVNDGHGLPSVALARGRWLAIR